VCYNTKTHLHTGTLHQTSTNHNRSFQAKTIETNIASLENDAAGTLPPLMNPAMLEASDDLTNLSHLNEPAGMC
jgi:myosin heavy subunit